MEKEARLKKAGSRAVIIALAAIAIVCLIYYANKDRPVYRSGNTSGTEYEVGRVTGILSDNHTVDDTGIWRGSMVLQVKILTGRYEGETVQVENYFSSLYNVRVSQGDKVSIRIDTSDDGTYSASVYNYYRVPWIILCVCIFIAFLVIIGGKKGAKSALGLIFTMICVIWILLPLALKGFSALGVTLAIILVCNLVSFLLIGGTGVKTVIAVAGSMCGVLAGAGFSLFAQTIMSITTYQMDEAETLLLIMTNTDLQIDDLLMCGILIACMGAVMDVSMSISSAMGEVHGANPQLTRKELFVSGMNIGKDAMGTMSNTLILAFAGSSLNMMLMIYSYGIGFQQLMNTDFVAIQIVQSIAGSIGIVCTVPITALIASAVLVRNKK